MLKKCAWCVVAVVLGLTSSFAVSAQDDQAEAYKAVARQFLQDKFSLLDLMKGDRLPKSYKPADLPETFKAFRIQASGGGGLSDLFGSPMGLMMMGGGGGREAAMFQLFDLFDLVWTQGDVIHLYDRKAGEAMDEARKTGATQPAPEAEGYLVIYRADLSLAELRDLSENPIRAAGVELKLQLVKFSSLTTVTPKPEMTKQRLLELIGASKSAMESEPSAGERAKRTAALSNAKQIAMALMMYSADYDDYLPYVQSTAGLKAALMPYLKNEGIWDTYNPGARFLFNMCLSGVSCVSIEEPAKTPMIYESAPFKDGTRIVAFADGHASRLSEADWKALDKYLKLKLPRLTKQSDPTHPK
jgi:hypothetical protein